MTRPNLDVDPDNLCVTPSENGDFADVLSWRSVMKGGTVLAATGS